MGKSSEEVINKIDVAIFGWVSKHTLTLPPTETWHVFLPHYSTSYSLNLSQHVDDYPKKETTIPLHRYHLNRKCHLPTINIQDVLVFKRVLFLLGGGIEGNSPNLYLCPTQTDSACSWHDLSVLLLTNKKHPGNVWKCFWWHFSGGLQIGEKKSRLQWNLLIRISKSFVKKRASKLEKTICKEELKITHQRKSINNHCTDYYLAVLTHL